MTRYHPLLVAVHWIMALLIILALTAGTLLLEPTPNDDPSKAEGLAGHMSVGLMIGLLLVLRILTRGVTAAPARASTGNGALDTIGVLTHWLFYALIAGMVLSGLATALGAGLFPIVYGGSGDPLPSTFHDLPQRVAHGVIAKLLMALIALHIAAAVYHQFVLKDGLLSRMWFGRRS